MIVQPNQAVKPIIDKLHAELSAFSQYIKKAIPPSKEGEQPFPQMTA